MAQCSQKEWGEVNHTQTLEQTEASSNLSPHLDGSVWERLLWPEREYFVYELFKQSLRCNFCQTMQSIFAVRTRLESHFGVNLCERARVI